MKEPLNLFSTLEPAVACEKAVEYGLTAKRNEFDTVKINSPAIAADFARKFYSDDISIYESAFIILLDKGLKTLGWAKIGQGGICGTLVDVRIIAKFAIESLSSAVIFVHNHPSGSMRPSTQDDTLTRRLRDGLATLDIVLQDSIIIGPCDGHYSYRDEGKL